MSDQTKVAFALGGLAGNNAFGAGFLQAALDLGLAPDMISCTSGQIHWVREYLRCKTEGSGIILAELVPAHDIFVVRPLTRCRGPVKDCETALRARRAANREVLPTNWMGIEDLKTEVAFNGAYMGERAQIDLINSLYRRGRLSEGRYHEITLHEIELAQPRGFFDYLFESLAVFDEGYTKGRAAITAFLAGRQSGP